MKNKKYFVVAPVDYVEGYLKYGHFEGVITLSEEEIKNPLLIEEKIIDHCKLVIDEYELNGYGGIENFELEEIETNEE